MYNNLNKKGLAIVLIIAIIIMTAVGIKLSGKKEEIEFNSQEHMYEKIAEEVEQNDDDGIIVVDIDGSVVNPGVYEMKNGDRVNDAITAAGGLKENSFTENLNKARKLLDGEKIYVYSVEESKKYISEKLININTASADDLISLPGIGQVYAQRIIEYREERIFSSIEEIKNINGIGDKTFEKVKEMITIE
ncbi:MULTISPECIES: ComEA family DNA-binding protein [unclassified Sedimentibacter]|uniref:ComEA family DNA-binding protein n=1 Tax=unclassified Sedimentibacter TaxID=2649220 RepID=UPI001BD41E4E|nr:ComEA family DNA-binding protein [Sedimentibacter sp. MB35-C1]WMJ75861.1 ComEA family DNA-binding protein [Sedimentibacter sp. MB35-C1]